MISRQLRQPQTSRPVPGTDIALDMSRTMVSVAAGLCSAASVVSVVYLPGHGRTPRRGWCTGSVKPNPVGAVGRCARGGVLFDGRNSNPHGVPPCD